MPGRVLGRNLHPKGLEVRHSLCGGHEAPPAEGALRNPSSDDREAPTHGAGRGHAAFGDRRRGRLGGTARGRREIPSDGAAARAERGSPDPQIAALNDLKRDDVGRTNVSFHNGFPRAVVSTSVGIAGDSPVERATGFLRTYNSLYGQCMPNPFDRSGFERPPCGRQRPPRRRPRDAAPRLLAADASVPRPAGSRRRRISTSPFEARADRGTRSSPSARPTRACRSSAPTCSSSSADSVSSAPSVACSPISTSRCGHASPTTRRWSARCVALRADPETAPLGRTHLVVFDPSLLPGDERL